MYNESFISEEGKLNVFRMDLVNNHFQEMKDQLAAQVQSSQNLHRRHGQEMAQISMLFNPVDWALAIGRYTRLLSTVASTNKVTRSLMKARHEQELVKLENLIKRQRLYLQDRQQTDILFLNRFNELFDWSFSDNQKQYYQQALHSGYALVLTDMTQSILWVSQAFETMTGYELTEITGQNARFLQGETTDRTVIQHLRKSLNQALDVEAELVNYRKRGEAYRCHLRIKLLRNRGGEPTHYIAIENEVNACH